MSFPAVTGSGESVLVTDISADGAGTTFVVALAVLLPSSGSAVRESASAVFVIVPAGVDGSTFTTSVTVADAPLARLNGQVMVVVPAHAPCADDAETNDVTVGTSSARVTLGASDGPLFVTVIV